MAMKRRNFWYKYLETLKFEFKNFTIWCDIFFRDLAWPLSHRKLHFCMWTKWSLTKPHPDGALDFPPPDGWGGLNYHTAISAPRSLGEEWKKAAILQKFCIIFPQTLALITNKKKRKKQSIALKQILNIACVSHYWGLQVASIINAPNDTKCQ